MSDKKFIDGLLVKPPRDRAPQYVVGHLSIKRADLIRYLDGQDGEWINADIKIAQSGNWYAQVDDWKPPAGGRSGGRQQRQQSTTQHFDNVRDQRLQDHQRNVPTDDFADDDLPF